MSRSGWTLRAIESLNEVDSWTGRIHIHKILYIADRVAKVSQPFAFRLYRYGPYSFELDENIRDLEGASLLDLDVRHPGYGPSYYPSSNVDELLGDALDLSSHDKETLERLAKVIGPKQTKDLEVIATCIWAILDEELQEDQQIIARVHELKPRYSEAQIAELLPQARELITSFSS